MWGCTPSIRGSEYDDIEVYLPEMLGDNLIHPTDASTEDHLISEAGDSIIHDLHKPTDFYEALSETLTEILDIFEDKYFSETSPDEELNEVIYGECKNEYEEVSPDPSDLINECLCQVDAADSEEICDGYEDDEDGNINECLCQTEPKNPEPEQNPEPLVEPALPEPNPEYQLEPEFLPEPLPEPLPELLPEPSPELSPDNPVIVNDTNAPDADEPDVKEQEIIEPDDSIDAPEASTLTDAINLPDIVTITDINDANEIGADNVSDTPLDNAIDNSELSKDLETTNNCSDIGQPCYVGIGACKSEGITICSENGQDITCSAVPLPPTPETCNGIDDDCDDLTDEDYIPIQTTCGIGECFGVGMMLCIQGQEVDDCTPLPSQKEICDGKDNNCDNQVDEGCQCIDNQYTPLPTTCGTGACSSTGATYCEDGIVKDNCMPETPAANDASCDNIDDDCDYLIDEHFVSVNTTCGTGACMASGLTSCEDGIESDSCTPGLPSNEVCDEIDNNCNGLTDEVGEFVQDTDSDGKCDELDCDIDNPNNYELEMLCTGLNLEACWNALTNPNLVPGNTLPASIQYYNEGIKICYDPLWTGKPTDPACTPPIPPAPLTCISQIKFDHVEIGTKYVWKTEDGKVMCSFNKTAVPKAANCQIFYSEPVKCNILFNNLKCAQ